MRTPEAHKPETSDFDLVPDVDFVDRLIVLMVYILQVSLGWCIDDWRSLEITHC